MICFLLHRQTDPFWADHALYGPDSQVPPEGWVARACSSPGHEHSGSCGVDSAARVPQICLRFGEPWNQRSAAEDVLLSPSLFACGFTCWLQWNILIIDWFSIHCSIWGSVFQSGTQIRTKRSWLCAPAHGQLFFTTARTMQLFTKTQKLLARLSPRLTNRSSQRSSVTIFFWFLCDFFSSFHES